MNRYIVLEKEIIGSRTVVDYTLHYPLKDIKTGHRLPAKQNAILMAFRWRVDSCPTLNTDLDIIYTNISL